MANMYKEYFLKCPSSRERKKNKKEKKNYESSIIFTALDVSDKQQLVFVDKKKSDILLQLGERDWGEVQ